MKMFPKVWDWKKEENEVKENKSGEDEKFNYD